MRTISSLFLPILFCIALCFTSCSKSSNEPTGNYTCDCMYMQGANMVYYNHFFANQKKSDVTTSCDSLQAQFGRQNGVTNTTCAVVDTL
jgi:hypothetical protein